MSKSVFPRNSFAFFSRTSVRYLENVRRNLSPATTRDYKGVIERYLIQEFGNIKLHELTRTKIQQLHIFSLKHQKMYLQTENKYALPARLM